MAEIVAGSRDPSKAGYSLSLTSKTMSKVGGSLQSAPHFF